MLRSHKQLIQVKFILPERIIKSAGRKRRRTVRSSKSAAPSAATFNYQTGTMRKSLKHSVKNIEQ